MYNMDVLKPALAGGVCSSLSDTSVSAGVNMDADVTTLGPLTTIISAGTATASQPSVSCSLGQTSRKTVGSAITQLHPVNSSAGIVVGMVNSAASQICSTTNTLDSETHPVSTSPMRFDSAVSSTCDTNSQGKTFVDSDVTTFDAERTTGSSAGPDINQLGTYTNTISQSTTNLFKDTSVSLCGSLVSQGDMCISHASDATSSGDAAISPVETSISSVITSKKRLNTFDGLAQTTTSPISSIISSASTSLCATFTTVGSSEKSAISAESDGVSPALTAINSVCSADTSKYTTVLPVDASISDSVSSAGPVESHGLANNTCGISLVSNTTNPSSSAVHSVYTMIGSDSVSNSGNSPVNYITSNLMDLTTTSTKTFESVITAVDLNSSANTSVSISEDAGTDINSICCTNSSSYVSNDAAKSVLSQPTVFQGLQALLLLARSNRLAAIGQSCSAPKVKSCLDSGKKEFEAICSKERTEGSSKSDSALQSNDLTSETDDQSDEDEPVEVEFACGLCNQIFVDGESLEHHLSFRECPKLDNICNEDFCKADKSATENGPASMNGGDIPSAEFQTDTSNKNTYDPDALTLEMDVFPEEDDTNSNEEDRYSDISRVEQVTDDKEQDSVDLTQENSLDVSREEGAESDLNKKTHDSQSSLVEVDICTQENEVGCIEQRGNSTDILVEDKVIGYLGSDMKQTKFDNAKKNKEVTIDIINEEDDANATYTCGICQKEFQVECELTGHIQEVHLMAVSSAAASELEAEYRCGMCQQMCKNCFELERHLASKECLGINTTPADTFVCGKCSHSFDAVDKLMNHIRINCVELRVTDGEVVDKTKSLALADQEPDHSADRRRSARMKKKSVVYYESSNSDSSDASNSSHDHDVHNSPENNESARVTDQSRKFEQIVAEIDERKTEQHIIGTLTENCPLLNEDRTSLPESDIVYCNPPTSSMLTSAEELAQVAVTSSSAEASKPVRQRRRRRTLPVPPLGDRQIFQPPPTMQVQDRAHYRAYMKKRYGVNFTSHFEHGSMQGHAVQCPTMVTTQGLTSMQSLTTNSYLPIGQQQNRKMTQNWSNQVSVTTCSGFTTLSQSARSGIYPHLYTTSGKIAAPPHSATYVESFGTEQWAHGLTNTGSSYGQLNPPLQQNQWPNCHQGPWQGSPNPQYTNIQQISKKRTDCIPDGREQSQQAIGQQQMPFVQRQEMNRQNQMTMDHWKVPMNQETATDFRRAPDGLWTSSAEQRQINIDQCHGTVGQALPVGEQQFVTLNGRKTTVKSFLVLPAQRLDTINPMARPMAQQFTDTMVGQPAGGQAQPTFENVPQLTGKGGKMTLGWNHSGREVQRMPVPYHAPQNQNMGGSCLFFQPWMTFPRTSSHLSVTKVSQSYSGMACGKHDPLKDPFQLRVPDMATGGRPVSSLHSTEHFRPSVMQGTDSICSVASSCIVQDTPATYCSMFGVASSGYQTQLHSMAETSQTKRTRSPVVSSSPNVPVCVAVGSKGVSHVSESLNTENTSKKIKKPLPGCIKAKGHTPVLKTPGNKSQLQKDKIKQPKPVTKQPKLNAPVLEITSNKPPLKVKYDGVYCKYCRKTMSFASLLDAKLHLENCSGQTTKYSVVEKKERKEVSSKNTSPSSAAKPDFKGKRERDEDSRERTTEIKRNDGSENKTIKEIYDHESNFQQKDQNKAVIHNVNKLQQDIVERNTNNCSEDHTKKVPDTSIKEVIEEKLSSYVSPDDIPPIFERNSDSCHASNILTSSDSESEDSDGSGYEEVIISDEEMEIISSKEPDKMSERGTGQNSSVSVKSINKAVVDSAIAGIQGKEAKNNFGKQKKNQTQHKTKFPTKPHSPWKSIFKRKVMNSREVRTQIALSKALAKEKSLKKESVPQNTKQAVTRMQQLRANAAQRRETRQQTKLPVGKTFSKEKSNEKNTTQKKPGRKIISVLIETDSDSDINSDSPATARSNVQGNKNAKRLKPKSMKILVKGRTTHEHDKEISFSSGSDSELTSGQDKRKSKSPRRKRFNDNDSQRRETSKRRKLEDEIKHVNKADSGSKSNDSNASSVASKLKGSHVIGGKMVREKTLSTTEHFTKWQLTKVKERNPAVTKSVCETESSSDSENDLNKPKTRSEQKSSLQSKFEHKNQRKGKELNVDDGRLHAGRQSVTKPENKWSKGKDQLDGSRALRSNKSESKKISPGSKRKMAERAAKENETNQKVEPVKGRKLVSDHSRKRCVRAHHKPTSLVKEILTPGVELDTVVTENVEGTVTEPVEGIKTENMEAVSTSETMIGNCQSFECGECRETFETMEALTEHIKSHSFFIAEKAASTTLESGVLEAEQYICGVCKARLGSAVELTEHMQSHIRKDKFVCGVCQRTFSVASDLENHFQEHLTFSEEFLCGICRECFPTAEHLEFHMVNHSRKMSEVNVVIDHSANMFGDPDKAFTNVGSSIVKVENEEAFGMGSQLVISSVDSLNTVVNDFKDSTEISNVSKDNHSLNVNEKDVKKTNDVYDDGNGSMKQSSVVNEASPVKESTNIETSRPENELTAKIANTPEASKDTVHEGSENVESTKPGIETSQADTTAKTETETVKKPPTNTALSKLLRYDLSKFRKSSK